ncbi:Carboxypeptidase A4-like protein 2 [Colletotrichum chlorophyti]|uniref:Carboxypeptidase A4-like protein 2 n=1 Tax=Colletotrichum chlorophyti TaxID=708187 RepID=A0A1Q8RWW5_9PEZI|nr:Carboxypeptidase A4-like protein 2 [Colletotrichum chlorophyti]
MFESAARFQGFDDQRLPDSAPISNVDRFENGTTFPMGWGTCQLEVPGFDFSPILNWIEIDSGLKGLEREYRTQLISAPHRSWFGLSPQVAFLPKNNTSDRQNTRDYRVFLAAGAEGRERGGPVSLLYFVSDVLWADKNNKGLEYGNFKYTLLEVRKALSLGIVVLPNTNPDGLITDQLRHNYWSKSIRPQMMSNNLFPSLRGFGVNIDRNYNFAWDYRRFFSENSGDVASDVPAHELYHGPNPFSESEPKNVAWVFDTHPKISWFLDIHAKGRNILHPWTHVASSQDSDLSQNFRNPEFDGKRGDPAVRYEEYCRHEDLRELIQVARDVASKMANVTGDKFHDPESLRRKDVQLLGVSSGSAVDWAYSRHIVDESLSKVRSFKFNLGATEEEAEEVGLKGGCPHYPTRQQYNDRLRESAVGYMTFLLRVFEKERERS